MVVSAKSVLAMVAGLAFALMACQLTAGEPTNGPESLVQQPLTKIGCDDDRLALAPYVWKCSGSGDTARAEATMPGAYLKLNFRGSTAVGLLVDGTANSNCKAANMPVIDFSVDYVGYRSTQLSQTGGVYVLPLAQGLDTGKQHHVEVYFRASALAPDRWTASTHHLRIAGVQLDAGGSLARVEHRAKRAIAFGDSVTEGVNVDGTVAWYSNLFMNNARGTWCAIAFAALDCEYGQLGTGGQGMVTRTMPIPPLPQTWDHYDAASSRLTNGLLEPEPDYIFCEMGTNDYDNKGKTRKDLDITAAYLNWLGDVRKSSPNARIFCISPHLGWHASEMQAVVRARNAAGDQKVYLIDTAPLWAGFRASGATRADEGATTFAGDGVHPTQYGNAMLGALIAVETQKALDLRH